MPESVTTVIGPPALRRTLVMDCDPGLDDALALLALAELARHGDLRLELVTSARGNVSALQAADNARFILAHSTLAGCPVLPGVDKPLSPSPPPIGGPMMHGPDGLGGLAPRAGRPGRISHGREAIAELASWMEDDATTILATAPLTNVASALRCIPGRRASAKIVIMGGAFGQPAGNVTPWAEYNFVSDAAAANAVLASALDVTVVPLDVTQRVRFSGTDLRELRERVHNPLVTALFEANLDIYRRELDREYCYIHDAVALVLMAEPDLMTVTRGQLSVVIEGEREGQVVLRRDRGTASVALGIDAERAKQRLLELWAGTQ